MEVVVRDVTIRGEVEYIIDSAKGMHTGTQLQLLMKASYNSLLTNPAIIEQNPKWIGELETLKKAVEKFLIDTNN